MKCKQVVALATVGALIAACTSNPGPKESVGTLAGAAIGGVLGSKIGKGTGQGIAIGLGALLGAGIGNELGKSLDRADMMYMERTNQGALENGQPGQTFPWNNPQTGNSGTITPSNYYQTANNQYCREYTQTVSVGGRREQGYGTACRQPDGTWQIVN